MIKITSLNRLSIYSLAGALIALSGCGDGSSSSSSSESSITSHSSSSSSMANHNVNCLDTPQESGYCLVWQDEFNGNQVDLSKWSYERNCYGGGNNEAQCYVDTAENVWVDGDILHLKAIRQDANGPAVHDDDPGYNSDDTSGTGTYTSGRLRSIGKGDWQYGRFEIRAKLPHGQGTWPAVWMLPTDWVYGGWASSGEIDIMEAVNLKVGDENRIHGTLHFGDNWPQNVYSGVAYQLPNNASPADGFHTYAIEWQEGEIRWYVDGDHYATQTSAGWYSANALDEPHAPFNQRFHLLLNLAVGGDWAGQVNDTGIDESVFPQELQIDFVRVYQCTLDPMTGRGCASEDNEFELNPGILPPEPVNTDVQTITLFDGNIHAPFQWGTYTESGTVDFATVDIGGEFGSVGQITYATDAGIGFFHTAANTDISEFSNIQFDYRIVNDPRTSKDAIVFRADCTWPCTSGDYEIGYPSENSWQHIEIPLASLAQNGLDLTSVNTAFILSPKSGNQNGVVLQIDNIQLVK